MRQIVKIAGVALVAVLTIAALVLVPRVSNAGMGKEGKTIAEIAVEDGRFKTLVAALDAAGLVDTLKGPGPFTVFAPTDDAFAKLPAGTVEGLLEDVPALKSVLLYHVVPGNVSSKQAKKLDSAKTAEGNEIKISYEKKTLMVNDAKVIIADIKASNGVIHVIDSVILPPN